MKIRDIIIAQGSSTNSNYASQYKLPGTFAPIASFKLLSTAVDVAEELKLNYHVGNLLSSDTFYNDDTEATAKWSKMNVMAIEMEAAALYMNAAKLRKNALAICTISDHILTGEETTAEERQNTFTAMMETALEVAYRV